MHRKCTLICNETVVAGRWRSKGKRSKLGDVHHETKVILSYDLLSSVLVADRTLCVYGYICDSLGITAVDVAEAKHPSGLHSASLYFLLFFSWQLLVSDLISDRNLHTQKWPSGIRYTEHGSLHPILPVTTYLFHLMMWESICQTIAVWTVVLNNVTGRWVYSASGDGISWWPS